MRPVKVEFKAFGPYVGYEKVDFEEISSKGLFLICGKTGIGKTMILDAVTFALFGKSSGHGRDDFESMRCTNASFDTDTFVRFEFENYGEYYRFERRLERKRKNLSAAYNVSCKDEEGNWHTLMENAKEKAVSKKAVEIIGLEYEQFRQVIVLPQGQFERLLTSNSDEKEKILTSIFGEDKWQVIADGFYNKAEKRKKDLNDIQSEIRNSLTEENCESISQLELAVVQKKEQDKIIDEEYQKANYEKIIKEQQEILAIVKRFNDLHNAENKVKELKIQKEECDDWEESLKDAKRADNVRAYIEAERKSKEELQNRVAEEENAKESAEEKKDLFDKASKKVKIHEKNEIKIEGFRSNTVLYESKRKDYEGLEDAKNELKKKKKDKSNALKDEKKAKEVSDSYAKEIAALSNQYTELNNEHNDLLNMYLAGITGELAAQLKSGMPCPVCGSTEHPHKAKVALNSITKSEVEEKKLEAEQIYEEMQKQIKEQEEVNKLVEEKHLAVEKANSDVTELSAQLDSREKNLVEGITTVSELEKEISRFQKTIKEYENDKKQLVNDEKLAKQAYIESETRKSSAETEAKAARKKHNEDVRDLEKCLKDNTFDTVEDVEKVMLDEKKMEELASNIAKYYAEVKAAEDSFMSLQEELKGKEEPDEEQCQKILDDANEAKGKYREEKGKLSHEIERLEKKVNMLKKKGEGIEEKIREAEEDFAFAKKLRGDSGTGLQRYVLGIMFSSVVNSANKMLEMVHGGRYRLYRSDEKAQGTNKRGLELKVYDKHSVEHDGRFVSTLSGGEKFLASLALSIGMSTVAQKSGIKIEALFIDEGFGSLDDDSIEDAMSVLNSIQKANGLVGIISHVQILQDQIPSKLRVEEDNNGSHIVQTVG